MCSSFPTNLEFPLIRSSYNEDSSSISSKTMLFHDREYETFLLNDDQQGGNMVTLGSTELMTYQKSLHFLVLVTTEVRENIGIYRTLDARVSY